VTLVPHNPLVLVVSPYHLTTREPAAMASLLLAEGVVTLLPSPLDISSGSLRREAEQAARQAPNYRKLIESWSWMEELWREGVISSDLHGEDAVPDMRAVCDRLESDPALSQLKSLAHERLFDRGVRYLDLIAGDLLKGGPDPGLLVPVAAGLDRFASRRRLGVARSHAVSTAQRVEQRLARRAFAFAMPILVQAEADRILEARDALEPQLAALRAPIASLLAAGTSGGDGAGADPGAMLALTEAASAYAGAFAEFEHDLTRCDDPYDPRTISGLVSVSGATLPADAVLSSSLAAARAHFTKRRASNGAATALAEDAATVLSLQFAPIGARR